MSICIHCGSEFQPDRRATRSCSHACAMAHRRRPIGARVLARLDTSADGCWIWPGSRNRDGYGTVTDPDRPASSPFATTHRVVWEHVNGPITDGLFVLHSCDVRLCCNPAHLRLGTHDDNMSDMAKRGRAARPAARLTEDQVRWVRRAVAAGIKHRAAARVVGVSGPTVDRLIAGRTWRRVDA